MDKVIKKPCSEKDARAKGRTYYYYYCPICHYRVGTSLDEDNLYSKIDNLESENVKLKKMVGWLAEQIPDGKPGYWIERAESVVENTD